MSIFLKSNLIMKVRYLYYQEIVSECILIIARRLRTRMHVIHLFNARRGNKLEVPDAVNLWQKQYQQLTVIWRSNKWLPFLTNPGYEAIVITKGILEPFSTKVALVKPTLFSFPPAEEVEMIKSTLYTQSLRLRPIY